MRDVIIRVGPRRILVIALVGFVPVVRLVRPSVIKLRVKVNYVASCVTTAVLIAIAVLFVPV